MLISLKQLDGIIDVIHDWSNYEVEVCGHDYDVIPSMPNKDREKVHKLIEEILASE